MTNTKAQNQEFDRQRDEGERFGFGDNWRRFLGDLTDSRIDGSVSALKEMLECDTLEGKTFLDIGSGSGLSSLSARKLGAKVTSFDYDPQSVACTEELKKRYFPDDIDWQVERGSALDPDYVNKQGQFDIVYSWGVLHHTGEMWPALANAAVPVKPGGKLFVAIYNDQGWISQYWLAVKKLYNASAATRLLMIIFHFPYLFGARWLSRALTGRLKLERGMSLWHDMLDWLGGLPFEVASITEIEAFYQEKGFRLIKQQSVGSRHGCNELVFIREKEG